MATSHCRASSGTLEAILGLLGSKKWIARDGKPLKPPMAFTSYAGVTDTDLDAIIAWLRTVPAANDDVAQGTTMH